MSWRRLSSSYNLSFPKVFSFFFFLLLDKNPLTEDSLAMQSALSKPWLRNKWQREREYGTTKVYVVHWPVKNLPRIAKEMKQKEQFYFIQN